MAQAIGSIAVKKAPRSSFSSAAAPKDRKSATSVRRRNTGRIIKSTVPAVPYEIGLDERLRKSPQYALDYLNLCLDDSDSGVFLLALRDVARAYGGMAQLAQKTGLNREALYNAFSKRGNPKLLNLESLLDAMGFRLKIALK